MPAVPPAVPGASGTTSIVQIQSSVAVIAITSVAQSLTGPRPLSRLRLQTTRCRVEHASSVRSGSSIANYYERRGRIPAFSGIALYRYGTAILGEAGATEREPVARVSADFFSTLGVGPAIGRSFTEQETSFDNDKVAILTDAYWRQHCNADPNVTGKQLRVDGIPMTVVGVLPPGFRFLWSESATIFPVLIPPRRPCLRAKALRRELQTPGRAPQAGRDHSAGAVPDRRTECRTGNG